jgi:hypothetical protein
MSTSDSRRVPHPNVVLFDVRVGFHWRQAFLGFGRGSARSKSRGSPVVESPPLRWGTRDSASLRGNTVANGYRRGRVGFGEFVIEVGQQHLNEATVIHAIDLFAEVHTARVENIEN